MCPGASQDAGKRLRGATQAAERPCLSFPLAQASAGGAAGPGLFLWMEECKASPAGRSGLELGPGAVGGERECAGARAEAVVSPCRMLLRAAVLAVHAGLLAALRPGDPNVCSYWER